MEFHPYSEEYPLMPAFELGRMEQGMVQFGFDARFPIVRYQGKILDGRNRYLASSAAKVKPVYVDFTGTDEEALQFVQRANEERRHLATEWLQRRRQERIERVAAARAEGESLRTIAEKENVSVATVHADVETATVQGLTVEPPDNKITGKDGRTRTAKPKPEPTLCERCTRAKRVGQQVTKNCPMCKELRGPSTKAAPKPTEQDSLVDDFQNKITKSLHKHYADPWIQDTIDFLAVMEEKFRVQRIADGMNKRKAHYPFIIVKDVIDGIGMAMNSIDEILNHIKTNRPAGLCKACSGKGCSHCRLSGMLPREVYEKLEASK